MQRRRTGIYFSRDSEPPRIGAPHAVDRPVHGELAFVHTRGLGEGRREVRVGAKPWGRIDEYCAFRSRRTTRGASVARW